MAESELLERFRATNQRTIDNGLIVGGGGVGREFDDIPAPSDWKSYVEFTVEPDLNELVAATTGDESGWYTDTSPFGYPLVHPVVLLRLGAKSIHRDFVATVPKGQSNLHARIACEFLRPARVGGHYRLEGRLAEKYRKRGKRYLVYEGRFLDDDGEVVMRYRQTRMVGREVESNDN